MSGLLSDLGLAPEDPAVLQVRPFSTPAHARNVNGTCEEPHYGIDSLIWGYVEQDALRKHDVRMRVVAMEAQGIVQVKIDANGPLAARGLLALRRGRTFAIRASNVFGWQ